MRKFLIVALCAGLLTACESAEDRAERHYQSALELLEQGRTEQAILELRNTLQNNQGHVEARRKFADAEASLGRFNQAFAQYLYIVESDPADTEALLSALDLSLQLRAIDRTEELMDLWEGDASSVDDPVVSVATLTLAYRDAVRANDQALRSDLARQAEALLTDRPDDMALHRIVVDYNLAFSDERVALEKVERAIEVEPSQLELQQAKLGLLNSLGEFEEVESLLRELTRRFPENEEIRTALFQWFGSRRDLDGAETFLRDLVAENPEDEELKSALLSFLQRNRSNDAAREQAEIFLGEGTNDPLFRSVLATIDFDEGKRETAIAAMQEIVDGMDPGELKERIEVSLARMMLTDGNQVGSRALIEQVLESNPNNVAALKILSGFQLEADDIDNALASLRSALAAAPDDASAMTLMARAHERAGNREQMAEMLVLAAEASDYAPDEALLLARHFAQTGRETEAERAIVEALRRSPGNVQLLTSLAEFYLRTENWEQAEAIESALRATGDQRAIELADRIRLSLLRGQERSDELLAMLDSLDTGQANSTGTTLARIRVHVGQGDMESARAELDSAIAADPDNPALKFFSAALVQSTGDTETALGMYQEILQEAPTAERVHMSVLNILMARGDFEAASAAAESALASIPESANVRFAQAGILEALGDIDGAIAVYEEMYSDNSGSAVIANNLASLITTYRSNEADLDRAYNIARRLRGIEQPAFQDTYGWIAFLRQDLDEALDHLEPAAAALTDDARVQYHLGRVYEALDRKEDAAKQYELAQQVVDATVDESLVGLLDERLAGLSATSE